ncbi:hypothetical protein ILUMI_10447 [Ignelater luminosus]|uniref:Tyr recombinase domain-containing protein n=1 Tax=Ignelater luminosus TaxID=2038154 RepID=A0A8K0GEY9_IGNLU|nr:hypothetical protein ILUMI_10447 [Ignelater luminosus]
MELREGLKFPSYEALANFITSYEFKTKQKYWKRSSRTIENARLRRPCNENLKYYEIRYSCMHGGGRITTKSKGLEKVGSQKKDCPAYIKVRASDDGQFLEVKHYDEKHENHAQSTSEENVEDLIMHRRKRRKREASPQIVHFRLDDLSSSLTTKQEDEDLINIVEHTIQDYIEPSLQSSSTSHENSNNLENQITSQPRLHNELTNDEFFIPPNQIRQPENLEARSTDSIAILNNEQISRIAPNERRSQETNQYSHTMNLCVLCAENISDDHFKKSVKEFLQLILNITSVDITQYPFESNCCETCYQFLIQIKDFQAKVKAANLLIYQKLQELSKEIEFIPFTTEDLPTTSTVEESNVFSGEEYTENEDNQYVHSLIETDKNTIIKTENMQNTITNANESICDTTDFVKEDNLQIIEDTNEISIKIELEEMDTRSIQIDKLNEEESNFEPIKDEYLTNSMNQYLSENNPLSTLEMNTEDDETELQCDSYEQFLKETNENECEERHVEELLGIPPDISNAVNNTTLKLIPEKSRQIYDLAYSKFKQWCENKKIREITEDVLLRYFSEIAGKLKSSSLWSRYSMLKASLEVKDEINIKKFSKLTAFLKWKSRGYCAEKSKTFSSNEIKKFLLQAPDDKYLMMKVVLILGVTGACRRDELSKMSIDDFEDTGTTIIVNTPKSETDKKRYFVIQGKHEDLNMANIFRKYATLRPVATEHRRFFLYYNQGQCTSRPVGINTFGKIPSNIAKYLELNNPNSYTGHCFRRSSAMLLANAGADVLSLKRHGGWKSSCLAKRYIKESLENKRKIANHLHSGDTPTVSDTIVQGEKDVPPLLPSSNVSGGNSQQKNECEENHVEELLGIPPDTTLAANNATLPEKSRQIYGVMYSKFKQWCKNKKVKEITEDVLLRYFSEIAGQLKSSSLWSRYSMLKASLEVNDDINIKEFSKLTAFLKWKSRGYRAEKSKTFSSDEIKKFLLQAPDDKYLMMKVVLILGVAGACRGVELCKMSVDDFEDTRTIIIINIPKSETKKERYFVIEGENGDLNMANIFRKYASLRPAATTHRRFFLCYRQGQCTVQPVGVNTFGKIPSDIAKYLGLNNPNSYTGHCFRRSSATLLANAGADVLSLKGHGGWKSNTLPKKYIKESLENKQEIANHLLSEVHCKQNTPTVADTATKGKKNEPFLVALSPICSSVNLQQETECEESDTEGRSRIPPGIPDAENNTTLNVLPEKSRRIYELTYNKFKQWCENKKVNAITEDILLRYFSEMAGQLKSSSLWSRYSMLRASLEINDNINIKKFSKLIAFLKWKSRGYCAEKSKTFSSHEINKFLLQAPDDKYLLMKVVLILGVAGACHGVELCKMSVDDFEDTGTIIIVNIPKSKIDKERYFVIEGGNEDLNMANIFRKYAALRPASIEHQRFFLCYKQGQCGVRPIGIHTFGKIPSDIAKYLGLNNPNNYTGHCFRRSSATLLANAGANVLSLKRHGGWKSKTLAERYIKESLEIKRKIANHPLLGDNYKQNALTAADTVTKGKKDAPLLVPSFSFPSSVNLQQENEYEEGDVEECFGIPSDVIDTENNTTLNVLPEKSRDKYELAYSKFKQWCENKEVKEVTENVLLGYFSEMAGQLKSSSLWSKYSMLKALLKIRDGVNIKKFSKLSAFLKWKSRGYCAQKSKTFSRDEIKRFLLQAPDDKYLMMKVVLILGVAGGCSRDELCRISIDDIEDTGIIIIVNIPKSETNKERYFVIQCENEDLNMAYIFRKYANLRPAGTKHRRFFLFYKQGQCTVRPVGINTFGKIPSDIAKYLGLNNPYSYSGHCFRRSSATLLANAGADVLSLKRHGGWKSNGVPERYIKESLENQKQIADQLLSGHDYKDSTDTVADTFTKDETNSSIPVPASFTPFNLQQKNECEEGDVEESFGVPSDITAAANNTTLNVLPEKSKQKYELAYSKFKQWCENKKTREITENVLLGYFSEIAGQLKSSSLWAKYSMLKVSIEINDGVKIKEFSKLTAFLKWKSAGYRAQKSKTFSRDEIKRFLLQAPDSKYLMMKVVLILGVAGACRRDELCKISVDDFEDTGTVIIVNIPKSETNKGHYFVIQGENEDLNMASIFRKYANLRPVATAHQRFFLCYKQGQCTVRPVGINTFGKIPSDIARYLGLNNPHSYTGHCFRRSSVTLFANTGANVLSLNRHGGWKSKAVAESYIKGSLENKKKIATQLLSGNDYKQNTHAVAGTVTKDDVCNRSRKEPYHCSYCNSAFDTELRLCQHECLHANSYVTSSVSSNEIPTSSVTLESATEEIKFSYSIN